MATFKQRALTIATVGLLSGSPITIATNGLIQQSTTPDVPVVIPEARPPSAGGTLRVNYSNERRLHSALRFILDINSESRYDSAALGSYKHNGLFYFDVKVDRQAATQHQRIHSSKIPYAISVEALDRAADSNAPETAVFDYGLGVIADSRINPVTTALTESELGYQIDVESTHRHIGIIGTKVYANIQSTDFSVDLHSKARSIPSGLVTHRAEQSFGFDIDGAGLSQLFTESLSKYGHGADLTIGMDIEQYAFIEHAPLDIRNEEEALIMLMARYLLDDD